MKKLAFSSAGLAAVVLAAIGCSQSTKTVSAISHEDGEAHLVAIDSNGVAVQGHDVVAYFTEASAVRGSSEHVSQWHGAEWHFSSAENKAKFDADPQRYAPQYGGFCAWGVGAKNDLFPIDPNAWKVVDDKLYLNNSENVQKTWLQDQSGFITQGDQNWPGLVKANASGI